MPAIIIYPNVPPLPGVPPLLRAPGAMFSTPPLLSSDTASDPQNSFASQWGIFDQDGNQVLQADSVISFDFKHEFEVSDFPIEDGGFTSYNKVAIPYQPRVVFSRGGTDADRTDFLLALEDLVADTNLYDVVTPEVTYPNANVRHYDYRRTSKEGVTLITANVWLEEIRVTVSSAFSNTKQPSGADTVDDGQIQPVTVTGSVITTPIT